MKLFFSPKSGEDQKKEWNTFFPRIQEQTGAQMHSGIKILEGMQMKTILKVLGGYSQIIGGDIYSSSPPPRVLALLAIYFSNKERKRIDRIEV